MSEPNQRFLYLDREKVNTQQSERKYLLIYQDNINLAYKILKGEKAFGIYLYLVEQLPHTYQSKKNSPTPPVFCLYAANIQQQLGITDSTYNRGIKKLIELGFLVDLGKNHYYFYEMPAQYRPQTLQEFENKERIELSLEEALKKEQQRKDEEIKNNYLSQKNESSQQYSWR